MPMSAAMSPPGLHLQVLGADAGLVRGQHLDRRLRVGEADQPALAQRIEGDDRHAAPARVLQLVQHARAVDADVLAEEEDAVGLSRSRPAPPCRPARRWSPAAPPRCFRGTCWSCRAGCCCRTSGPAAGTCRRSPARRGPRCRTRPTSGRASQFRADVGEGLLPAAPPGMVACRVPAQRRRQPALVFQRVVGPGLQLGRVCGAGRSPGATRLLVISQAVALAPFSQNSAGCGWAGLAQAQLTQAKPSGLFCFISTPAALAAATFSWARMEVTALTDPHPPAGWWADSNFSSLLMTQDSPGQDDIQG